MTILGETIAFYVLVEHGDPWDHTRSGLTYERFNDISEDLDKVRSVIRNDLAWMFGVEPERVRVVAYVKDGPRDWCSEYDEFACFNDTADFAEWENT